MTTEQKNIAIAEMLGGHYKRIEELSFEPKGRWHIQQFPDAKQNYDLKFHSDANWQFEACKFITKTYDAAWKITSKFCEIHNHNNGFDCRCEINCPENPLLDMFECLYQFSQYIKQK